MNETTKTLLLVGLLGVGAFIAYKLTRIQKATEDAQPIVKAVSTAATAAQPFIDMFKNVVSSNGG